MAGGLSVIEKVKTISIPVWYSLVAVSLVCGVFFAHFWALVLVFACDGRVSFVVSALCVCGKGTSRRGESFQWYGSPTDGVWCDFFQ